MRSIWLLVGSEATVLAFLFLDRLADGHDDFSHAAMGTFELGATVVSLLLLLRANEDSVSPFEAAGLALAALAAATGFAAYSSTLLAFYLILLRGRDDLHVKAAGTVMLAVTIQTVWAPIIFSKLSFLFLAIDAGLVGTLLSYVVPGASSSGTLVTTPSGHDVLITAGCASFRNLSLASLAWVTLTMLHRPYWIKSDLYAGLGAMLIQFALNVGRLMFCCMSVPMYEFWHDGVGKHIFSATATACAILFVQLCLMRSDRTTPKRVVAVA